MNWYAVAAIYRLYEVTRLPLIGIGGVTSAQDVVEFVMAGASAVPQEGQCVGMTNARSLPVCSLIWRWGSARWGNERRTSLRKMTSDMIYS